MRTTVVSAICLISVAGFSQHHRDTLQLYYAINEIASSENSRRLDSLSNVLKNKVVAFWIYGHADFLNNPDYNIRLSQKRAEAVQKYLSGKLTSKHLSFIACEGRGEKLSSDNGSKEGEPSQRRVEVIFEVSGEKRNVTTLPRKVPRPGETSQPRKKLEDLSSGESIVLEGLSFQPGRHFLMKSSVPIVKKLLQTLKDHPAMKIEIQGHICCTDGNEDGLDTDTGENKLSLNRAKAVYDFLVAAGISPDRLEYAGYAHSRPKVSPETTPSEEQMNRRVEILVTER